ncbi:MAG TPA: prepilin-type N-terminal cleavage/methylation domain-containing protein [Longimicrobium sp.]|nr:prepilin-type N-terminal cleavage/methylation domain-containing protein [Longimicrobium sp.]
MNPFVDFVDIRTRDDGPSPPPGLALVRRAGWRPLPQPRGRGGGSGTRRRQTEEFPLPRAVCGGGPGRGVRARRDAVELAPRRRATLARRRSTSPRSSGGRWARFSSPEGAPRAGFTLVEMIVALVISGVVAAAGYGVLAATADARAAVARSRAETIPGPAVRATLDGWLRAAALWENSGPFRGRDRRLGPLPVDDLSFTVEDGGSLYPGRRRVTLWIERDRRRAPHGLLAEIAPAERRDADRTDTLALAPTAVGLNVRYRARVRMKDAWLDGWDSDRALPEALEVTVLPAPELAGNREADGLPDVLRMPVVVPLRPAATEEEAGNG